MRQPDRFPCLQVGDKRTFDRFEQAVQGERIKERAGFEQFFACRENDFLLPLGTGKVRTFAVIAVARTGEFERGAAVHVLGSGGKRDRFYQVGGVGNRKGGIGKTPIDGHVNAADRVDRFFKTVEIDARPVVDRLSERRGKGRCFGGRARSFVFGFGVGVDRIKLNFPVIARAHKEIAGDRDERDLAGRRF